MGFDDASALELAIQEEGLVRQPGAPVGGMGGDLVSQAATIEQETDDGWDGIGDDVTGLLDRAANGEDISSDADIQAFNQWINEYVGWATDFINFMLGQAIACGADCASMVPDLQNAANEMANTDWTIH